MFIIKKTILQHSADTKNGQGGVRAENQDQC
jgi:hypothetical protein